MSDPSNMRTQKTGEGAKIKVKIVFMLGKIKLILLSLFLKRPHAFIINIAQHAHRACPRRTSGRSLSIDQREEDGGWS